MMKYYTILIPAFLLLAKQSVAQFKNTFAANGNPTTQIIDANGMKQGSWNYFDSGDHLFMAEFYQDNNLIKRVYDLNGTPVNAIAFNIIELSDLNKNAADLITKKIQSNGSGEIIVLNDGSVHLHFYINKSKSILPSAIQKEIENMQLPSNSIIKF